MAILSNFSSHMPMHVLVRPDQNRLIVQSSLNVRIITGCLLVLGALVLAQSPIIGAVFLFGGGVGWLGPPRAVFDLERQTLYLRRWLMFRRFPLSQISAVEVQDGGWHTRSRGYGRSYQSWQLTLNMDSSYAPRLHLTNHGDQMLTRSMAREIALFLGRPFHDETAHVQRREETTPATGTRQRHKKKKKRRS